MTTACQNILIHKYARPVAHAGTQYLKENKYPNMLNSLVLVPVWPIQAKADISLVTWALLSSYKFLFVGMF